MTGYQLSAAAARAEATWRRPAPVAEKATWSIEHGRPGGSDRDNFTTNRVTVAAYDDWRVGCGNPLGLSATFACVNLIAGTIASLTPSIYKTSPEGVRQEARDHPLFWLLRLEPNYDQSAYEFWEFAGASIELHGNAYAEVKRNAGHPVAIEPIRPDLVTVRRGRQGLEYEWTVDGQRRQRRQEDMLHIRGFGGSPLGGASTLALCAGTFGAAMKTEHAADATFTNGIQSTGVLSIKEALTPELRAEAQAALEEKYAGTVNRGRPLVLDNGVTWVPISITPEDAQMLESRKYSGEEICRLFGVPPAMVGFGDKSSNWGTGKEVDVLGFIKFTMRKRLRRIEQALMKQLLTRQERQSGVVIEFNLEGLLRGDSAGRAAFYQIMVRLGVMTRNEARRLENMPPIPGGDVAMVQMQDVPLATAIAGEETE